MKSPRLLSFAVLLLLFFAPALAAKGGKGRIEGRVTQTDGSAMAGVGVVIEGISLFALTDANGRFEFKSVRAGTYTLTFSLLDNSVSRPEVTVERRATTTVEQVVDWQVALFETVTVRAVSRRLERIVEAPAAVTTIPEEEMARQASHGLPPKLFEFTPGVDITQINIAEFLVSTRGFNGTLNRRVPLLIDGRDMTDPFIGATEWPTVSFGIDDFAQLDLVRGPASALYGANATGGLVSITTKAPRDSLGGMVRLTGGELDSFNGDLRWAGGLGEDWYVKVLGGGRRSNGYSVSRNETTEYFHEKVASCQGQLGGRRLPYHPCSATLPFALLVSPLFVELGAVWGPSSRALPSWNRSRRPEYSSQSSELGGSGCSGHSSHAN